MAPAIGGPAVGIQTLRMALTDWFANKNSASINFSEQLAPAVDPQDDYVVAYEAVFEPVSLDQARVEIWVTDDGYVAVLLESRARIARRLGVRAGPAGLPVGHEPTAVDQEALFVLLDAVAAGQIAVRARVHLLGLGSVKALASAELRVRLHRAGYRYLKWIALDRPSARMWPTHVLRYRPW